MKEFEFVCSLLECSADQLKTSLTEKIVAVKSNRSIYNVPQSVESVIKQIKSIKKRKKKTILTKIFLFIIIIIFVLPGTTVVHFKGCNF